MRTIEPTTAPAIAPVEVRFVVGAACASAVCEGRRLLLVEDLELLVAVVAGLLVVARRGVRQATKLT